jgi:anaerobic selenocysteine-containing dehydrogenase
VSQLSGWTDHDLEAVGRLAEPMSYDPDIDQYTPIGWEYAFALVGQTLRGLASPHDAAFYTSGRLSNEATFLYQLWVREFALTVRRGSRRSAGGRSHPAKRTPAPSADRPPSPLPGRARPG